MISWNTEGNGWTAVKHLHLDGDTWIETTFYTSSHFRGKPFQISSKPISDDDRYWLNANIIEGKS